MTRLLFICIALTVMFFAGTLSASGQDVSVKVRFDTTQVLTGDQLWFTVTLEKPEGERLSLQRFADTLAGKIEILRGPVSDTVRESGREIVSERYLVTSFDSGRYEVPPVFAEVAGESGVKRYYSDYTYLVVNRPETAPADSTMKFFDIVGPYRAPVTAGEILPWILAVAMITAIAWFLERYYRNRRKPGSPETEEIQVESPHVIAYRSLEKLKGEKLWQKGKYKEYYTRLSEILRNYIDMRFGLNSLESTTYEILRDFEAVAAGKREAADALKQVLTLSDMVKFAKLVPDSSDCELSIEQSWSFVSLTRKEKSALQPSEEQIVEGGEEL